ncbi:hypothetical protein VFPPC_05387 [Pochonia chlamydosporia 170]|uniref:Uncharacterized protein n=1 Tax=Pochonia chlamydosporia 170 TaxID=1380566 RepID=A0A179FGB9_METCM|nr:hypothetical protein VFPPC_05387 [Pochonia chlamydosporia 170]OAQ64043.1 hypothetical protein VFPPC_05387 [Pochonia chlamydosporia 170]
MRYPIIHNTRADTSPLLTVFLQVRTRTERFINVGEDPWSTPQYWSTTQHEQFASDLIDEIQHRYDSSGPGRCHERTVEELIAGYKRTNIHPISSVTAVQGSLNSAVQFVQRSAARPTPCESCPSLENDHSDSGQDSSNASISLEHASSSPAASICPPTLPDPPIFASIRQVLASDPSYAEDVISAVSKLPHHSHNLLMHSETECAGGSPSAPPKSSAGSSKKRRRSDDNSNDNGSRGDQPAGETGGGKREGETGGGAGGGSGTGPGNNGGGDDPPRNKKRNKDKKRRWIYPYCLAYPEIRGIFVLTLSRTHLKKHHSPNAKSDDPNAKDNARFYMDSTQLTNVLERIDSYKERPRELATWISYWKALFIDVWYIIFPKERFPHFKEPLSPFYFDSGEIENLGQHLSRQAGALVEPIYDARAVRAVKTKAVASKQDFRPSEQETKEMMSEAIAIALLNSPVAIGATQWLARASPQTLQTAVGQYGGVPSGANDKRPATPSSATVPRTPESAPIGQNAVQAATSVLPTVPLTLFPNGTRVTMDLSSIYTNPLHTAYQVGQLTLPPTVYVASMSQVPLQPPSTAPVMAISDTTANVTSPAMEATLGTDWRTSIQLPAGQGAFMQQVQETPLGQEQTCQQSILIDEASIDIDIEDLANIDIDIDNY